ncbi:histidyl-tRNA synthetase [Hydrogenobacter thermophilus TK-6]|uniref:Histidine--tRNA ligase n=1 Tax=Hydrogenobacter thermophilus (strain DSM 6534 / IAM 12695 / TK-6) TaxID=608538 RepID=D3DGJ4_HYDTT|nr:histidine--tRNA ligase [Hydrogenobacter thermophilus]ADO44881.1 histidyl-tRNA synthetase [Hydrogenobacter thermophilus TK-6]BAI68946.1 histidyl-tRNA synthetase [Hydrogenobacter thermophilus TK-6]
MAEFQSVRGFHDIFGQELKKFRYVSDTVRSLLKLYNFEEIILPVVEYLEVFQRSIGEVTDIVQKEMFVFQDRKGRWLALRPEGTAGAVRAYIQNRLYALKPYVKLFYEGPMFRYERPQAGRYRQFHQIGAEVFGTLDPQVDAQMIEMVHTILTKLGISATIEINSIGCRVCRPSYKKALSDYLEDVVGHLCDVCLDRKDKNPLRVLDCKVETCKEAVKQAPKMVDYLCQECATHYETLKSYLDMLSIPYRENHHLVRGLDYYTKTVFEAVSDELGITIIAGGRYDYLVEEMGGPPTPAIGFAVGIERISMLVKDLPQEEPLYMVIPFGDTLDYAFEVIKKLRDMGKRVETSYKKANLKKQLELANKLKADYVVLIGEDEKRQNTITIKNMHTGMQESISFLELAHERL